MSFFDNLSIRRKLTLIIMITTCMALLLASILFLAFDLYSFRKSQVRNLETLAQVVGSNSTAALTFEDADSAREVLQSLAAQQHVQAAALYRADGSRFVTYTRGAKPSNLVFPAVEPPHSRFEENQLVVFRIIVLDGRQIGTIFLAEDLQELRQLLRWYATLFVIIVLGLSAGAFLLAARMQKTVSDPILSLARTTNAVTSARDYSIRVPVGSNDELGTLSAGFNQMLAEIQRRDRELQQAQNELEDRVHARTAELRQEISVREQTESALRESEERTRLLLDSTAEAIFGVDPEGRCTFCNQATLRLLGYTDVNELLGRKMHDLMHHTRPDGSRYSTDECPMTQALQNGQGCHRDDEVLWRADGSSFPAEYWGYPVRRKDHSVGAVITFLEITERRAAQQAMQTAK